MRTIVVIDHVNGAGELRIRVEEERIESVGDTETDPAGPKRSLRALRDDERCLGQRSG